VRRVASSPASRGLTSLRRAGATAAPSRLTSPARRLRRACRVRPPVCVTADRVAATEEESSRVSACAYGFSRTLVLSFCFFNTNTILLVDAKTCGLATFSTGPNTNIPSVCILGVGPYLVGGPGRPPRLPASRAGPAPTDCAVPYGTDHPCFGAPARMYALSPNYNNNHSICLH